MDMPSLTSLNENEFENFTFDLLCELGLKNCIWRTPGSDQGRDIEGEYFFTDVSGYCQNQKWYIECKRYTSSVDWPTVWNKISYAEVHNADVLLFSITSSLSPQAIDQVNKWNESKRRPIIRIWNSSDIYNKLRLFPHIAMKYGFLQATDANISLSLFPLVQILLKTIYSLSSGIIFCTDITAKAELSHAITDLIAVRINDYKFSKKINIYRYIDEEDRFDWLENSKCIESTNFDRYAIRAIFSYLKSQLKLGSLFVSIDTDYRIIISEIDTDDTQRKHLQTISSLSNFRIIHNNKTISLEN